MWKILLIEIVIILIIFLIICFYNFAFNKDVDHLVMKNLKIDELQTGDIILSDFQNFNNMMITSFFRENFMHANIIYREGEEVYIIDYIYPEGLVKRTISDWLISNRGSISMINKLECDENKREHLQVKLEQLFTFYERKLERGPVGFSYKWKRFWWPDEKYKEPKNFHNLVCLEVIIYFLMEAGVVKKEKPIEYYLPRHFENMNNLPLSEGYKFKEKYLFNSIIF